MRCARLDEVPGHPVETAEGLVREMGEGGGREVEVVSVAASAAVGDRDSNFLALVCRNAKKAKTHRVRIGIEARTRESNYLHCALTLRPQMGLLLGLPPV